MFICLLQLCGCKAPLAMCRQAEKDGAENNPIRYVKLFVTHLLVTQAVNIS